MQGSLKMEAGCGCKILLPMWYNKLHGVISQVCNQNLRYPLSVISCLPIPIITYAVVWSELNLSLK